MAGGKRLVPPPSGTISYGDHVQVGDLVYSLDKFRPRFPLRWQQLRVRKGDKVLPLTDDNVRKAVFEDFIEPLYLVEGVHDVISSGPAKRAPGLFYWAYEGVRIVLQKFKPFGAVDFNYSLVLEFNPNKQMDNPILMPLMQLLRDKLDAWFFWSLTRLDYALDLPYPIRDVRLLSRKQGSSYLGTYYFGARGQTGYTRVYDKRRELLVKKDLYGFDIGREVTRVEYELHNNTRFYMDPPFLLGDLGRHEVLRYVPMNDWPAALRTFDPKTASKIRKNCLKSVPFDPGVFQQLQDRLLERMGLDMARNCDHLEKRALDAYEADCALAGAELERFRREFAAYEAECALEQEQLMSWLSQEVGEYD